MERKKHYKEKHKYKKDKFSHKTRENRISKLTISEILRESIGNRVSLSAIVDRVVQTGGPTVFHVSDGTGTLALKAFQGAGVRAYPEIKEGEAVHATIQIEEFQDELEGEIIRVIKLNELEKEKLLTEIKSIERKRAEIRPPQFLVKSPILDKLKDRFIKAATEIRLAIIQNRPIIVRHHNDTDGYSSGFTLEKAILPLIEKQHIGAKAAWEFFTRAPCAAPFYEIDDSIRDTALSLSDAAKFSNKMPLVIIADNGSSSEDLLGIKQGKVHGMEFIVVDHHYFDKDVISEEVLVHINPFLVKEDGAKFSAGMLCTELARFINPEVSNIIQIAAMAGLADRIDNQEVMKSYLDLAARNSYSKELLGDISTLVDFVSSKLRFLEAREYIEVLFGEPRDKQKELVKLLAPYIRKLEAKGLEIAKTAVQIERIDETTLQLLNIEEVFPRGFYPKPGKCIGLLHDNIQDSKGLANVVSVGILSDALTIRATDEANFSVHNLIAYFNKNLPYAFAEGGGHKNAGAIKFIPNKKEEVLQMLRNFIRSL